MNKYFFKAFLISVLFGLTLTSYASLVTCTGGNTLSLVEHATACQRSTEFQDFTNTNPITVNQEVFFGFNDWTQFKKDDPLVNGQSGSWSLTNNEWATYANIMLIFKDGSDTTLLGFLLTPTFTSGDWDSPFTANEFPALCVHHDAKGNNPAYNDCSKVKNVSHVSYYGRGTPAGEDPPPPTNVSEPGSLLLMLFGLAGLAFVRRQRI